MKNALDLYREGKNIFFSLTGYLERKSKVASHPMLDIFLTVPIVGGFLLFFFSCKSTEESFD